VGRAVTPTQWLRIGLTVSFLWWGIAYSNSVVKTILILGLLVYIHELGHLIAAIRTGVRAKEFAFGFGPLWVEITPRQLAYTIRLIPLGGFVNLAGALPEEKDEEGGLMSKSRPARAFVYVAGPLFNLILAFLIFTVMGVTVGAHRDRSTYVAEVLSGSEAARAGLRAGDQIVAIDGRPIKTSDQMLAAIGSSAGRQLAITVRRDGEPVVLNATPRPEPETPGASRTVGRLGFRPGLNFSNEVFEVTRGSAAERAGLKKGDRIVAIDGRPIDSGDPMLVAISARPDQPITLTVLRDGRRIELTATPEPEVLVGAGPLVERAMQIGLMPGDQVLQVNDRPVRSVPEVISALDIRPGPAKITVERDGKRVHVTAAVTPEMVRSGLLLREGRLGFIPGVAFERVRPGEAVAMAWGNIVRVFVALGDMVWRNKLLENAGGPIMMYRMVDDNAGRHPAYSWSLAAQLSISLAVFNLLFIPPLDGGHLLLLMLDAIYVRVRRRPLPQTAYQVLTTVGVLIVGVFMLTVMYNDIVKLISGAPLIQ